MRTTAESRMAIEKAALAGLREVKRQHGDTETYGYQYQRNLDLLADFAALESALAEKTARLAEAEAMSVAFFNAIMSNKILTVELGSLWHDYATKYHLTGDPAASVSVT